VNILIVTDAYPPARTSGATHIYDLSQAFLENGHQVSVLTPVDNQNQEVIIELKDGVQLFSVKAFQTKDIGYVRRLMGEFLNPYIMWRHLKSENQFKSQKYDGIVWYSPTIFWGPLIKRLKKQFQAKSYLILRDIFPDWALDIGLIKKGPIYYCLKMVERYQYHQADVIGVQSPNNLTYFKQHNPKAQARLEVLWNWIGKIKETPCSIDLSMTRFASRKIFVYAGNMGVAQGMDSLIELAEALKDECNIGFVFIGRGSEVKRLKDLVHLKKLNNILFFDEINPSEIPGLYRQCSVGLIALDSRHRTQNIPGKFLTYIQASLPVLCFGNKGNDLQYIINEYNFGYYYEEVTNIAVKNALSLIRHKPHSYGVAINRSSEQRIDQFFSLNSVSNQVTSKFID
jgi:glycosyltransferase involved in cell wall biosynthesis